MALRPIHEVVDPLRRGGVRVSVLCVPECRKRGVEAGVGVLP